MMKRSEKAISKNKNEFSFFMVLIFCFEKITILCLRYYLVVH